MMSLKLPPFSRAFLFLAAIIFSVAPAGASAADPDNAGAFKQEFGVHLGKLVPGAPTGVTEIMGLGGARYGRSINRYSFYEFDFMSGAGNGVVWQNLSVDYRTDLPTLDLLPFFNLGLDVIHYDVPDYIPLDKHGNQLMKNGVIVHRKAGGTIPGVHFGIGLQTPLVQAIWLRPEMKLNMIPRMILYVGLGLEFRM